MKHSLLQMKLYQKLVDSTIAILKALFGKLR